jgi:hypothetical protein
MSRNLHLLVSPTQRAEINIDNVVSNATSIYRCYTDLYIVTAPKDNQFIQKILTQYHCDNITDRKKISRLLKAEHGIIMR